jgi:hypothetical protein
MSYPATDITLKGSFTNNLLILPVDLFPDFNFLTEQYLRCSNSYIEKIATEEI